MNRFWAIPYVALLAVVMTAAPASGAVPPPKPRYEVVDLGTLDGDHAYLLHRGRIRDLTPAWGSSGAVAISDSGWVAGYVHVGFGYRPFVWRAGTLKRLGSLGGTESWALGVNNHGQVLGYSGTRTGEEHGFLYQRGRMIDLTTLGVPPQTSTSGVDDINDRGDLVGKIPAGAEGNLAHAALFRRA